MKRAALALMMMAVLALTGCPAVWNDTDPRLDGDWLQVLSDGTWPENTQRSRLLIADGRMEFRVDSNVAGLRYVMDVRRHTGDKGSDFLRYGIAGEWSEWTTYYFVDDMLIWNASRGTLHFVRGGGD